MPLKNINILMLVNFASFFFISSCALQKQTAQTPVSGFAKVKFLNMYRIPNNLTFENTKVGGLSGIDYNPKNEEYYLICDDRSSINPARYYTAKINITNYKITNFKITRVDSLKNEEGNLYPSFEYFKKYPNEKFSTPDPEEIRYFAPKNQFVWSSEGERITGEKNILSDPFIQIMKPNGEYLRQLPIPNSLKMSAQNFGPRKNGVLEGLSFTPDYKSLIVAVEEPLYQDGPPAATMEQETWCRILKYDFEKSHLTGQYAYPLGKVVRKPIKPNLFKINGISSILSLNEKALLVVERSFSIGYLQSNIRVYLTHLENATSINDIDELSKIKGKFTAAQKELLINFDKLGVFIDNVEGITFGPKLPNGHQTLLFVTDNNFKKIEKQQLFLFELIP